MKFKNYNNKYSDIVEYKQVKNNKRVSVAIPHSWRTTLREMAKKSGTTVNKLILEAVHEKYKFNF